MEHLTETTKKLGIVPVPSEFGLMASHPFPYPEDNYNVFEEWFYKEFRAEDIRGSHVYLPIFWTGYYVRANYGNDKTKIARLQKYLDSLDRKCSYYTIVQYDDGILNDLKDLDIKVFSMCGNPIDYALPLLCPEHRFVFMHQPKTIFANFVGKDTHAIRREMINELADKKDYFVTTEKYSLQHYCEVLSRSTFTLCPRGYGKSSFRIMEALQYNSIPVYISDKFVIPHGLPFHKYGITIHAQDIDKIDQILKSKTREEIERMQYDQLFIYKDFFTYEANKEIILRNV